MVLDDSRLLLAFASPVSPKALTALLRELKLEIEPDMDDRRIPGEQVNNSGNRVFVHASGAIDDGLLDRLREAGVKMELEWIGPVYRLPADHGRRSLVAPLPNVLLVKLDARFKTDEPVNKVAGATMIPLAAADGSAPQVREVEEKSRYLNGYRYFVILDPTEMNAFQMRDDLAKHLNRGILDLQFESMPLIVPITVSPNDTLFAQQWNMTQIDAGGAGTTGWDISTGVAGTVVAVIDSGCDLTHPDLVARYATQGIRLDTMAGDGSPVGGARVNEHGTACAGIVAATFNNALGVAGVAGNAGILPLALVTWSEVEIAAGITFASMNGADVISMSLGAYWAANALGDPAIQTAFNNGVILCAATGNDDQLQVMWPANNPLIMACGASDQIDGRKTATSPDGEVWWGSNFGPEVSVVAPGVLIPTTDRQGVDGYNTAAGVAGDYAMTFNGTSSATPHVAGLAALVRSAYPALTNVQVRALIERTAEKVGVVAYAETTGYANGTWNQEMGYGRINVMRALDAADVYIKDNTGDTGVEPSAGNFWDFSDIVVRINDDNVFNPSNPSQSKNVERGQANYIYVQVTNLGPRAATNVTVSTRITPYVGLQFSYPSDWTLTDAMHVAPTPITASFASVAPGGTAMAKFRIEAAQTETLYGWQTNNPWHPCLLANVNADNDYAFATATLTGDPISARRNNLAQRNLTVIDVLAGTSAAFPFVAGNFANAETRMAVTIDRSRLPKGMPLLLSLDDDGSAFPLVDFAARPGDGKDSGQGGHKDDGCGGLVFLDRTRVRTRFGCCDGELTLEKGSRFDCPEQHRFGEVKVEGGDVIVRGGRRFVELTRAVTIVRMAKAPGRIYAMSLQTRVPPAAKASEQFLCQVSQQNSSGVTVGGAAIVYIVK